MYKSKSSRRRRRARQFGKRQSHSPRKKPIGYYRDGRHRIRPITARSRLPPRVVIVRDTQPQSSTSDQMKSLVKVTLPMAEKAFGALAQSTPFVGQVYTTIQVAKLMYQWWDTIRDMSNAYDRNGWEGVIKVAGKEMARNYLSSTQADIVWNAIEDKIQPQYSRTAKTIVEYAVNKLTDEEVDYVDRWLSQN